MEPSHPYALKPMLSLVQGLATLSLRRLLKSNQSGYNRRSMLEVVVFNGIEVDEFEEEVWVGSV